MTRIEDRAGHGQAALWAQFSEEADMQGLPPEHLILPEVTEDKENMRSFPFNAEHLAGEALLEGGSSLFTYILNDVRVHGIQHRRRTSSLSKEVSFF
jgi:hypothetical protein